MPNRLAGEASPYLRQHAHNPVDWYPWGPEALTRARAEDLPILLSIGYSSCHWCHVMERESFADPAVAAVMNERFVNIKVDREERPDIDQIYMRAVQAMTGSGGWPLTVFLTPLQEPYYGGTYFPPEPRHGLPSFQQVLRAAADAYRDQPGDVRRAAAELLRAIGDSATSADGAASASGDGAASAGGGGAAAGDGRVERQLPGAGLLDATFEDFRRSFDPAHGGFGRAPKFPQPVTLEVLLRAALRAGDGTPLAMLLHTLRSMAAGGIRDHLGGGFHRYAVDARWLVPHFEKMLYDNVLLARSYTEAYRTTGAEDLAAVARETLDYVLADLTHPEGGFYTARDADSEGVEGRYYVWRYQELREILDPEAAALFADAYGVTERGNFEGANVLHQPRPLGAVAAQHGLDEAEARELLAASRRTLLAARALRTPPFRDEKVITGWNGMSIRAFAEAARPLGEPRYARAAERAASFLLEHLRADGRLHRVWGEGRPRIDGFLEDYAAAGNGLLSLYETAPRRVWMDGALWCAERVLDLFWDETRGLFYDAPHDAPPLVLRPRDTFDNAVPAGTSLATELLVRLFDHLGHARYLDVAERALAGGARWMGQAPRAHGRMLSVLDRVLAEPVEVAVAGRPGEPDFEKLLDAAWHGMGRRRSVAGVPEEGAQGLPLLEGRDVPEGRAVAYVCRARSCLAPTSSPDEVRSALAEAENARPDS